jgi:2-methylcitrate dehydratase PrpD
MELSTQLANWVMDTDPRDIPRRVLKKAKIHFLDTLGVMMGGTRDPVGKIIVDHVRGFDAHSHCTVVGTKIRTAPSLSALANGVLGHALDFDDTSYGAFAHISVTVLPAALAVGEWVNASGSDVLEAFVIGCEVASKLGQENVSLKLYEDGWFSTSLVGVFGAAAAAGRLLSLSEEAMVHAISIAASEASGILGNNGTMVKPLEVGRAAESGMAAALLAQKGLRGSPPIFEKHRGFRHAFRITNGWIHLRETLGHPFEIDEPGFHLKEFPSCAHTHPALNALNRLVKQHAIDPDHVESIDCASTHLVVSSLPYASPRNVSQARFSMPFCLAVAALGRGEVRVGDFCEERLADPRVREMMKGVVFRISPELGKKGFAPADGPEAATVEIILRNGRRYRDGSTFADWRPDHMPSMEALTRKYLDCVSRVLPEEKVERSLDQVGHLEDLNSIRELMVSVVP